MQRHLKSHDNDVCMSYLADTVLTPGGDDGDSVDGDIGAGGDSVGDDIGAGAGGDSVGGDNSNHRLHIDQNYSSDSSCTAFERLRKRERMRKSLKHNKTSNTKNGNAKNGTIKNGICTVCVEREMRESSKCKVCVAREKTATVETQTTIHYYFTTSTQTSPSVHQMTQTDHDHTKSETLLQELITDIDMYMEEPTHQYTLQPPSYHQFQQQHATDF